MPVSTDLHDAPPAPGPAASGLPRPPYQSLANEEVLWQRWREQGDLEAREFLARHYMAYARALAAQAYSRRINDELEFDEYLQFATVGMMEALDRFEPSRGVLFKTFATRRITGAVLSGVASLSERYQQLALRRRIEDERAASLSGDEVDQNNPELILRELAGIGVGLALGFILDGTGLIEGNEPALPDNTYSSLELRQFQQQIVHLLKHLTAREQEVIRMHYFHSIGFDDIAHQLGLTKGRISQLHKQALARLRSLLAKAGSCDVQL